MQTDICNSEDILGLTTLDDESPYPVSTEDPSGAEPEQVIDAALQPFGWLSTEEHAVIERGLTEHLCKDASFEEAVRTSQERCNQWQPEHTTPSRRARRLIAASMICAFHNAEFRRERRAQWRAIGARLQSVPLARQARQILSMRYRQCCDVGLEGMAQRFNLPEHEVVALHNAALDASYRALCGKERGAPARS